MKLSWNVERKCLIELNRKTMCAFWLSKGRSCNISGKAKVINLKRSGNVEESVELNKKTLHASGILKSVHLQYIRHGLRYKVEAFREY